MYATKKTRPVRLAFSHLMANRTGQKLKCQEGLYLYQYRIWKSTQRGRSLDMPKEPSHTWRRFLPWGSQKGPNLLLPVLLPLGDPVEINVRGFNLTLRKAEADILRVERSPK